MKPIAIPAAARRLLKPLTEAAARLGLPLYVVGGPVRDWLLGRTTKDIDLCTEGDPEPLAKLCAERIDGRAERFGQFNTWRVLKGGLRVDLAMCRRETYAEPAALPEVAPAPIEQDLFRRDFTVNAMALRLSSGELVDPYGGLKDLKSKTLRVLHAESFRDDPTRVFRAARYLCRFGLKPAPDLVKLAEGSLLEGVAGKLSRHRLAQELLRILGETDCAAPLLKLRQWGYLELLHPGLKAPPARLSGVDERLAALVLALGKSEGEKFLASLPIERALSTQIYEMLSLVAARQSPRTVLGPVARRVLPVVVPKLAPSALKPVLINGRDLQERGLTPGADYRSILDAAALLQWKGVLKSRAQALKWLDATLKRR